MSGKLELFQDMWIPVSEDRLPPDNNEEVLLYNSKVGLIFTYSGHTARTLFDKNWPNRDTCRTGGIEFKPSDITHWMPVFPPDGQIASCEYYHSETPTWKQRNTPRRRS